jgi:hypothetical protein
MKREDLVALGITISPIVARCIRDLQNIILQVKLKGCAITATEQPVSNITA